MHDDEQPDAEFESAIENSEMISELGSAIADAAIASAADDAGRSVDQQKERMGDHFEYLAVEQDPHQMQLDKLSEKTDEVDT